MHIEVYFKFSLKFEIHVKKELDNELGGLDKPDHYNGHVKHNKLNHGHPLGS